MDIGQRLDEAMRYGGFGTNQSALSRKSSVPQPTINRILKSQGAKGPETETIKKLAIACKVNFSWLMENKGAMEVSPESGIHGDLADAIILLECFKAADSRGREMIMESAKAATRNIQSSSAQK